MRVTLTMAAALVVVGALVLQTGQPAAFAEKQAEKEASALKRQLDGAKARQAAATKVLDTAQKKANGINALVKKLKGDMAKAQAAVADAQKKLDQFQSAIEKQRLQDEQKAAELQKQADEALTRKAAAAKVLKESQQQLKSRQDKLAEVKADEARAKQTMKQAQSTFATVSEETLRLQKAAEAALIKIDKLVSFSHKIAPIFARRCLACHNTRTSKGRFNMESFAGIVKGGESGAAVDPGDGDSSNLFAMVEGGDMPLDDDPLTQEEIALIKKWIDTGAKLDAGLDPSAPLITIMPKLPQPLPPNIYRVPMPITALAFSPDGSQLASSGYHELLIYHPADGKQIRRITNVAERVYDIQYSADGKTIAVAAGTPAQMGEAKLFNAADGKLLADFVTSGDSVYAVAFSPDGKRLATGGADRAIRVYDLATGKRQLLIEDHADWVMDIAWSPDGSKLASASRDKTSKVFDMKTGDSLVTFNSHGEPLFGVGFTPDGKNVVTSGRDKNIRVWGVGNAKQVRAIGGFGGEVFRIALTKDGRVFSSCADKTARLHTIADGKSIRTFSGHKDRVYSVAFNAATKKMASGSYDGEIRIWNVDDGKPSATFFAAPGYKAPETTAAK